MSTPTLDQRLAWRDRPTSRSPVMYQTWRDLLFLHWRVDPADIQRTLPAGLTVDTFDGNAYIGVVPFYMRNIRPRFCPTVPGISNFLEVNLRTYVHDGRGTAGVWFYSLDANQWLAVQIARLFFKLPYFYAKMIAPQAPTGQIDYQSYRHGSDPALTLNFNYAIPTATHQAEPGTLEFFLVERYILFSTAGQQLYTGQVHHPPYEIAEAEVSVYDDHLLTLGGFAAPQRPPDHTLVSPGVDVDVFAIQPA